MFANYIILLKCLLSGPQRNQLGSKFVPLGVIKISASACCSLFYLIKKQEETTVLRVGKGRSNRNVAKKNNLIPLVAWLLKTVKKSI